ncbi:hypothetical protein TRAPUB_1501 [Trametes pubescens]|uniref:Uncharacterized protein n=1 Tax=Trametes pubescens TaxID=154538 RepID=A0A1M2W7P2_TRAPU|nr:hypothetical protein TRAPUB_1501 [Trametes pubescens]
MVSDTMLTALLVYILRCKRTGFKSTDTMIDFLVLYAVNTGTHLGDRKECYHNAIDSTCMQVCSTAAAPGVIELKVMLEPETAMDGNLVKYRSNDGEPELFQYSERIKSNA